MTTFHDFALKRETYLAERAVKPILKIRNTNDVSMCIWFTHSRIKNF